MSCPVLSETGRTGQPSLAGFALVEVIVFMVVVATAVGATLSLFANANRSSAELMFQRQAMAMGEAMLNEVLAAPFTYCDPQPVPANFFTVTGPAMCAQPEVLPGGPEAGEGRLTFDNVNDYNGLVVLGGTMPREGAIAGLGIYTVSVAVKPMAAIAPVVGTWHGIPGTEIALVTVTVSLNNGLQYSPVVVQGVRTRYAPTILPPP